MKDSFVKEDTQMMNVEEVARAIEWFKARGLSDSDLSNFITYIATGVGLPTNDADEEKSSD